MAVGCGAQCAKILLIVFNIIFWLSGAALLGLGIWMFVDDEVGNYIKIFEAFDDGGSFMKYSAIVFICAGCFVLLVGFLGCCGAIKENRCMLGMYIFFLVIIMAAEIAAAVFILIFRTKIIDDLEDELTKAIKDRYKQSGDTNEAFTEGLDWVQEELKCCGVINGEQEYQTSNYGQRPASCCEGKWDAGNCPGRWYDAGCKDKIEDWIEDNSIILMVVGFCIAGIEIFGFIFAVCLCRNVGEED